MEKETRENSDEIIIAGDDLRMYIGECVRSFTINDQLTLSAVDKYEEKMRQIYYLLRLFGIAPDNGYKILKEFPEVRENNGYYENRDGNEIIIADKDPRIYLGECIISLATHDKIVLSAGNKYIVNLIQICDDLAAIGIMPEEEYTGFFGRIKIKKDKLHNIIDKKTGKAGTLNTNKVELKRMPYLVEHPQDRNVSVVRDIIRGFMNKKTGRIGDLRINKLGLTKIPELFRFTRF